MSRNHSDPSASASDAWSLADVVAVLEHAAMFLQASVSGLKNDRLEEAPVVDEATVRDIVTHLAAWEGEFLREAQQVARGRSVVFDYRMQPSAAVGDCLLAALGTDGLGCWEQEQRARRRDEPTGAIFLELERTQQQLIALARALPARALSRTAEWPWGVRSTLAELLITAASHKRGHAEGIRSWRTRGAF